MISEHDLLERFERVECQKDSDWLVTCPAHDDGRPSLHVTRKTNPDRWLLHCFAGCAEADVCRLLGLTTEDLGPSLKSREPVAVYVYTDELAVPLFEVGRFEPKKFLQRLPGRTDWKGGIGKVRRVLYRLPTLTTAIAAGRRIWIVEGEKDVHALEAVGEVATCNPGGAGKWRAEYAEPFRGAMVTIIADRDPAGRAHALAVAASLEGVAATVQAVELAEAKDAADHLNAGRGLDEVVPLSEPTIPAPETAELLAAVDGLLRRFVILPSDAAYLALSLFALHTHGFGAAHATPYLVVESPEKQSGKTRLLEVLELVCRNPLRVASITPAALFQSVAQNQPTLMIDEADALFAGRGERNEELRGVLNAGNAPGSMVIRGGKDGSPTNYEVFCPKVIAGIATGKLSDTIRDRAIVVSMDRKLHSEPVERLRRHLLHDELDVLRSQMRAWAEQHHAYLHAYCLPVGSLEWISDRLEEAWEPLLAIADLAGGQYPAAARAAAIELAGEGDDGATTNHALLVALRDVFGSEERMSSAAIVAALNANDELPFGAWNDGQGVRPAEMARLLKPYRVGPKKIRIGSTTLQGYQREWFDAAWARYGTPSAGTAGTSQQPSLFSASIEPEQGTWRSTPEISEKPRPARDVPGVPDKPRQPPASTATPADEARIADILDRHADLLGPTA